LEKLANPVLNHLAKRELRQVMPVETSGSATERSQYTHLEAFGRLLAGMSPWLAAPGLAGAEVTLQKQFIELAHRSLDAATDPASPDFMNFTHGGQALVGTAFLAQAILRAPAVLWEPLDMRVKRQVVEALKSSRAIPMPADSNWVLFAAMVEVALLKRGEPTIADRLENCLRQMLGWYQGDGAYGDGEWFHFDYYHSFVIQPMLLDVLGVLRQQDVRFGPAREIVLQRVRRYAAVQERLIVPDGTFPSLGRSVTYRFGTMQLLAQISLVRELPAPIQPAQVRSALSAVVRKMIEVSGAFDEDGWLHIGFCGHQSSLFTWRALYLHRKPLFVQHRFAGARPAAGRSLLERSSGTLDVAADLVRRISASRPCDGGCKNRRSSKIEAGQNLS
jgi:hypothetical protein